MNKNLFTKDVAETFLAFAHDAPAITGLDGIERTQAIRTLGRWPELKPLLRGVCLRVTSELPATFRVVDKNNIDIAADLFAIPAVGAFHLRHALEIAVWRRIYGDRLDIAARLQCAIAACHTAFSYYELMIAADRINAEREFPHWMQTLYRDLRSATNRTSANIVAMIGAHSQALLVFQGVENTAHIATVDERTRDQAYAITAAIIPYCAPCERLLTLGGDTRMDVREDTVLNQYGCSPRPRPWAITFASCTATSISDIAYSEAERTRQWLLAQGAVGALASGIAEETERVRVELSDILGIGSQPGTEIVLTSSGTDAEYYALHFALGDRGKKLVNILVAPNEVGSGTSSAAAGLHFDQASPFGAGVQRGSPIEGWSVEMVQVARLDIRDERGSVIPIAAIDASVRQLVDSNIADGHLVLVHLVDSSKTGLHVPGFEAVRELKSRHGDRVQVMVDAAQMRLDRRSLLKYLEAGFMVLITGSKFFTGAPFSGALLIPLSLAGLAKTLPPFPRGLSHYSSRYDFPPAWNRLTGELSSQPNVGLLMRWRAALWEMRAFYAVPAANQFQALNAFGQAVCKAIAEDPNLELIAAPSHERSSCGTLAQWDELPTIFTFLVKRPCASGGPASPLDFDQAWAVHGWLNSDISGYLPKDAPANDLTLAAKRCHVGQPVRMYQNQGIWIAALRVAAGGRLVSYVEFNHLLGETREDRLASQIRDALIVFDKLSLIVSYWDNLATKKSYT